MPSKFCNLDFVETIFGLSYYNNKKPLFLQYLLDMENFQLTFSAFLFPAIPLMMLNFGNRWVALSTLIRKVHTEFINKKVTKKEKSAMRYLEQIKIYL